MYAGCCSNLYHVSCRGNRRLVVIRLTAKPASKTTKKGSLRICLPSALADDHGDRPQPLAKGSRMWVPQCRRLRAKAKQSEFAAREFASYPCQRLHEPGSM